MTSVGALARGAAAGSIAREPEPAIAEVPLRALEVGLWLALALVCAAIVWLVAVLVREWRRGELW
jgi:hypothetical protein